MAKLSSVNKNNRRIKLSEKFFKKRENLKKIVMNKKLPLEERFKAQQNYQNCREILQKIELEIDVRSLEGLMVYIVN